MELIGMMITTDEMIVAAVEYFLIPKKMGTKLVPAAPKAKTIIFRAC
ncbi:hypothetical protein EMIT074MI3_40110 [Bacillus licheniformis]